MAVYGLLFGAHFVYMLKYNASTMHIFLACLPSLVSLLIGFAYIFLAPRIAGEQREDLKMPDILPAQNIRQANYEGWQQILLFTSIPHHPQASIARRHWQMQSRRTLPKKARNTPHATLANASHNQASVFCNRGKFGTFFFDVIQFYGLASLPS